MITNALELAEILLKYDMERGLVSIITPMYKGAKFVGDTMRISLEANLCELGDDYRG